MKRLLTSAAMFLCSLLTFAQFSGSGSGTENDPYLIFNPIQLNQMRNFLNKNGVYFKLMADIDLTEFVEDEYPSQGWLPIGSTSAPFRGILDGNSHVISGLWISRENSEDVGFFGNTSSCTIKDLTISAEKIEGKNSVGVIFGCSSKSLIRRCTVSGKVNGFDYVGGCVGSGDAVTLQEVKSMVEITGHNQVGGLIGQARGNGVSSSSSPTILGCKIVCQNIKGNDYIGGLCGSYNGTHAIIESCFVNADICGNNYVGGITGQVQNVGKYNSHGSSCNIIKCGYSGDISGNSYVGGISGEHSSQATLDKCFALARINAIGNNIGGIVGYSDGTYNQVYETLSNSYFSGSVIGGSYTSGIVGYKYQGRIENCYSNASVAGTECVGGIFGYARGYNEYHNFKSTANIANLTNIKASKGKIGRIYGEKDSNAFVGEIGTAADNKALNKAIVIKAGVAQDVNDSEQNGTGVSSTTLKLKATYVAMGWDFNDTWEIQETESYPYFKIQTAPPVITSQVVSGATAISGKCIDGGTVTLEIDGVKQQMVSIGNTFSFTVSPLQAGHEVRVSAKAEGKEQSYYTTETIAYLGKGTESDPYQVYTASDLTGVYRKGYFKLMNDIDLTSYINQFSPTEGWQSIGREGSETIHFDGNGHKITGLWCNSTRDNTGLFSCFANGSIKNLTVVTANGKQVKGGANTGILIGKLINGTITNCKATGTVADGTPVGGMIGMLEGGKLIGCQADVTINVTGEDSNVGGLAGEVTGDVEQCLSYGTLTATGKDSYVGGLVGLSKSGSSISNSYSSAVVNSSLSAAGIVAYNYGVVDKCYAVGNLFSKNYGAGVVGYNDGEGAVVKNCAAMNNKIDVTYESQSAQGGNYGMRIIGGIKNGAPAPEMNNYALKTMQVSVNDVPQKLYDDILNGVAKTAAQLKSEATYKELGWDFNSVWKIEEGSSYPYQTEIIAESGSEEPINPEHPDDTGTVSVTDISKLSNAIYAQMTSSQPGFETNLTICLKNAQAATAYSFDLQLPAGVTLATNGNGDYQYTLSKRHNGHSETVNYQSGSGVYSFAVLSLQSKELNGNDGTIWTLRLKVANNVAKGDYAIKILNAKYSIASGSAKVNLPETTSKLTISDYKKGDANNDGDVDIADAVCIVNHVVGLPTPSFVKLAADANGDGDVDIADAVRIVNLVVGKINALSRGNGSLSKAETRAGEVTDAITVGDISVWPGDKCTLTVSLKNSQTTNAYSFDLVLPEGVSIVQDSEGEYMYELSERHNGHMSTLNYIGNNTYSFAILSLQSKEVKGNEGAICTFKLKVAETAGGKQPVIIKNAKYSLTSGASKVTMPESTGQLTIKKLGDANGDGDVTKADVNAIAQYIMGQTPTGFDKEAADANQDNKLNAADIVTINNIIKNKK